MCHLVLSCNKYPSGTCYDITWVQYVSISVCVCMCACVCVCVCMCVLWPSQIMCHLVLSIYSICSHQVLTNNYCYYRLCCSVVCCGPGNILKMHRNSALSI